MRGPSAFKASSRVRQPSPAPAALGGPLGGTHQVSCGWKIRTRRTNVAGVALACLPMLRRGIVGGGSAVQQMVREEEKG